MVNFYGGREMIIGIKKSVYDEFTEINKSIDRSKLVKKQVTDKNGHVRTVWVKPNQVKAGKTTNKKELSKEDYAKKYLKEFNTGKHNVKEWAWSEEYKHGEQQERLIHQFHSTKDPEKRKQLELKMKDLNNKTEGLAMATKMYREGKSFEDNELKADPEKDNKITVDKVYDQIKKIVSNFDGVSVDNRYKGYTRINTDNYYIDVSGMDKITEEDTMNPYISFSVRTKAASGSGEKTVTEKDFKVNYQKGMESVSLANFFNSLKSAIQNYK
ncbi:MAG: hypothetical protein MJ176_03225 [Treponema sp.]|nr:hypothetical protein [Treponema sp.]